MSSSRSTNNWSPTILLALLVSGIGQGCRRAEPVPAPPRPVYVRLAPLLAAHPLQREVKRLRTAEKALLQSGVQTATQEGSVYRIPALSTQTSSAVGRAAVSRRRQAEIKRLQSFARQQIDAFLSRYRRRRRVLAEQNQTELLGESRDRDYRLVSAERKRIYQEMIDRLTQVTEGQEALTVRVAIVRSRLVILLAQLEDPEIPLVVLDKQNQPVFGSEAENIVEEQIAALETNPREKGISERAHLQKRQREQEAKLLDLTAAMERIRAEAEERIAAVARDIADRREKSIAEFIQEAESDTRLSDRLIAQEKAITEAGDFDRSLLNLTMVGANGRPGQTGPMDVGTIFQGPSPQSVSADSIRRAADRLAAQRRRLLAFIDRSVRGAIADLAEVRSLDLRVIENDSGTTPVGNADLKGRADVTQEFAAALATYSR